MQNVIFHVKLLSPTLNPLNEEYTELKNKIIIAFHIYSNFDNYCILIHSIFLGLNFGAFYFLGLNLESFYFLGS